MHHSFIHSFIIHFSRGLSNLFFFFASQSKYCMTSKMNILCTLFKYCTSEIIQAPASHQQSGGGVSRIREALVYRGSRDSRVSLAGIEVRTGRKWRVKEGLEVAASRLRHRVLVGTVAGGRAGMGFIPQPRYAARTGAIWSCRRSV